MAIELVTGYTGTPHISAADDGELNAGIFGTGNYVLQVGNQFAASIDVSSGNKVTIGSGSAMFEGRHVRITGNEVVSFTGGSQGVKRRDAICIHYYRASDGKENANIVLIPGTAGVEATDPVVPNGSIRSGNSEAYMLLYYIEVNGINYELRSMFSIASSKVGNAPKHVIKEALATGTSGNWEWTAWSNGELEMSGKWTGTANCNNSWGSGYYGDVDLSKMYPTNIGYAFIKQPKVFIDLRGEGGYFWALCWGEGTVEKTCRISPTAFGPSTGRQYVLDILAKGWWK